ALRAWQSALEAVPGEERALANLLRLGAEIGELAEVAGILEGIASRLESAEIAARARLVGAVAAIYARDLNDPIRATRAYRRLFEIDPQNPEIALPAAEALSDLYRRGHAWDDLILVLRRRAEWSASPAERRDLLAE